MDGTVLQKKQRSGRGRRDTSSWLAVAALALTIVMLVSYCLTGKSTFTPVLSTKVLAMMGGCILLDALFSLYEVKLGKYAMYLLGLWTWLEFLLSQLSYISNVLVGIDGNLFSIGFLLTTGAGLLAWIAALVSAIRQKTECPTKAQGKGEAHE